MIGFPFFLIYTVVNKSLVVSLMFQYVVFALMPECLGTVEVMPDVFRLFKTANMHRPKKGLTYTRHTHPCPTPVSQPCGNNRKCVLNQAKV